MEKLKLIDTEETPLVILDKEDGLFKFKGISIVENGKDFYYQIIDWVKEYVKDPNEETEVSFHMEYCNTASSKQLYEIIISFVQLELQGKKLFMNWYYDDYDDDMQDLGNSFRKVAFEGIKVIPNPKL